MSDGAVTRKLTAILYADVAGYSRLTGADEVGTHRQLSAGLDLIAGRIEETGGRVVHYAGDAVLAEFASVVAAVETAVGVQKALAEAHADTPAEARLQFRIGVNLGEVIVDRDDIYGDGVNVAARLESLADPGGVCVSGAVFEQVKGKLDVGFQDMGPQDVKNIAEPVRAYRTLVDAIDAIEEPPALPDIPSIAVLPFDNLSGDTEQEFFADGMTEDIITGLSHFRWLFVIARNSTFTFKGRAVEIAEVAKAFGVRYVMEGSVRKAGNKVRITAQLIDATTGGHIWADRYDRDLDDIFAVQDEITEAIVAAIAPEIDEAERALAQRKPPESLDVWGRYQRGLAAYYVTTREALDSAIEQFDEISRRDPTFAPAFALAADSRIRLLIHYERNDSELLSQAHEKMRLASALEPRNPTCLMTESRVYSFLDQHEVAISKAEEAVSLNPNSEMANYLLGFVLGKAGRCDSAIDQLDRAIRLSPRDAFAGGFFSVKSILLFQTGRYHEAFECAQRASSLPNPRPGNLQFLAASLIKLGRRDEAVAAIDELLRHQPEASVADMREKTTQAFSRAAENIDILVDALREAGLPE